MAPGMITLHEFTRSIESYSIEYYKSCILKTNQFSTKYILQKLIESHNKVSDSVKHQEDSENHWRSRRRNIRKSDCWKSSDKISTPLVSLALLMLRI